MSKKGGNGRFSNLNINFDGVMVGAELRKRKNFSGVIKACKYAEIDSRAGKRCKVRGGVRNKNVHSGVSEKIVQSQAVRILARTIPELVVCIKVPDEHDIGISTGKSYAVSGQVVGVAVMRGVNRHKG